jgi:hypothetical protein
LAYYFNQGDIKMKNIRNKEFYNGAHLYGAKLFVQANGTYCVEMLTDTVVIASHYNLSYDVALQILDDFIEYWK